MNKIAACIQCGTHYVPKTSYPKPCKNGDIVDVPVKPSKYCPSCHKERKATNRHSQAARLNHYGISEMDFARLVILQEGKCAICKEPVPKPCIDHDHLTGKVRGLLCDACNAGLGFFKDSQTALLSAIQYLKVPPMCYASCIRPSNYPQG